MPLTVARSYWKALRSAPSPRTSSSTAASIAPSMGALLDEYRLAEVADRPAADLNNAQQKMLDLVRALATRPRLLLLDELAAGLNPAELDWIAERIKALVKEGMAIIV